jgi:hypothetical protein
MEFSQAVSACIDCRLLGTYVGSSLRNWPPGGLPGWCLSCMPHASRRAFCVWGANRNKVQPGKPVPRFRMAGTGVEDVKLCFHPILVISSHLGHQATERRWAWLYPVAGCVNPDPAVEDPGECDFCTCLGTHTISSYMHSYPSRPGTDHEFTLQALEVETSCGHMQSDGRTQRRWLAAGAQRMRS